MRIFRGISPIAEGDYATPECVAWETLLDMLES